MSPTKNSPRRFRLQVSLRVLLLLMAVIGVSLAVYRWPWEETKQHQIGKEFFNGDIADYVTTSTWHRNWRGTPVLHGAKLIQRNKQLRVESNYYDGELHGPRRVYDHRGRLLWEAHYRNGRLHGKFRAGNGEHWYWSGEYWADEPHGIWEFITYRPTVQIVQPPRPSDFQKSYFFFAENAAIIARRKEQDVERNFIRQKQSWQRGQRHGEWKWEALEGELLSAAEYNNGDLVRWNGEDVAAQFWEWLRAAPLHSAAKSVLYASQDCAATQEYNTVGELSFRLTGEQAPDFPLVVYSEHAKGSLFHLPKGDRALVPMLCELACTNGYAFDCRYGTLWLVPHADPAPAFVDRTGVMQISFPEGSPQARDWLAEVEIIESHERTTRLVERLLSGSSISCEENIPTVQDPLPRVLPYSYLRLGMQTQPMLNRLPRRDAVGLLLFRAGLRCEQRGNEGITLRCEQEPLPTGGPFADDDPFK
jgi:antitoxin component YwqK of YwqJK toxin-antitoxin module